MMVAMLAALCGMLDWRFVWERWARHAVPLHTGRWLERWILAGSVLFFCGGGWLGGQAHWVEAVGEPLAVSLVQTHFEQAMKWNPEHYRDVLNTNLDLVRASRGQLVVLPETALPTLLDRLPAAYLDALNDAPGDAIGANGDVGGGTLVSGILIRDDAGHLYNAATTFGQDGGQHYAKRHLVPFGEYSPPLFGWFYKLAHIPVSEQSRGAAAQPPFSIAGHQVALNICYVDVFGEDLLSSLPAAGLMLNVSNLAWYGDSFAQPQHLQIARVRALESGRPMLRATNTGMTALVLPDGSVPAVLPPFTRGVLEVSVRAHQGMTPYARWGNLPVLLAALVMVAGLSPLLRHFSNGLNVLWKNRKRAAKH
jgi:apolipoprotein N-acyltransferase